MMFGDGICGPLRPFRAWYLFGGLLSQGVALGYRIKPRWGRGPAPRWGAINWFEDSHRLPSGGGGEEDVHRLATRGYGGGRGKCPPSGDAWLRWVGIVRNPKGVKGDSPGQRPGYGIK